MTERTATFGHVADEGGLTTARSDPGRHRTLVMGSTKEVS